MKHLVLRNSFWGIAASMTALIATAGPGSAQCVPGLGGSSAQFASQDWSRRSQEITAFQVGNGKVTLQRPTQLAARSGSVYVLDAGTNMILGTSGVIGISGLPIANPSVSPLPGTVTQIRYTGGFLFALGSNGYLTTPFVTNISRNYTYIRVSPNPLVDVTFDGQYLWVSDNSNSLYKVLLPTPSSAASVAGRISVANSATPGMLAFDGQHVWATNNYQLVEIDTATGNILNTVVLPETITSLTFDGLYFWTGGAIRGNLTKVDALNHQIATSYPAMVSDPQDLVFDGKLVWMPNSAANALTTVRACDGAINSVTLAAAPSNLAFDGNSVWITYSNSPSVSIR